MKRDGISREKALEWIDSQWSQEEVEQKSDFIVVNDGKRDLDEQVLQLLSKIDTL